MCACRYKTAVGLKVCSFVWREIITFQIMCENMLTVKNMARVQNFYIMLCETESIRKLYGWKLCGSGLVVTGFTVQTKVFEGKQVS
jgi:hypothetical protein